MNKNSIILSLVFFLIFSFSSTLNAAEEVIVGAYEFPPFYLIKSKSGITVDLVKLFNQNQKKYHFKIITFPPKRRYAYFKNKKYDVIFFESMPWGWKGKGIQPSKVYLKGGEVYVALRKKGRTQSYFINFENKRMIGLLGYHYGFADFNADQKFLTKKFDMALTKNHVTSMKMLLLDRGDIAVFTKSWLSGYLKENPGIKSKVIISKTLDQTYNHTILARVGGTPSIKEIDQILNKLERTGKLEKLWKKWGLESLI